MVVARVAVALALLVALAAPAQALFEDLTFTTLLDDPQDNVGFLDLQDIAVAETGASELVIRYGIDDTVPATGNVDQDLFFTVDGTTWSTGVADDATPAGNGNYDVPDVKSCVFDGGHAYCVLDYEAFGGAVGVALTAPYAISYAGSAQDYGPALGGFVPHGLLGAKGTDYIMTGCTRTDGACPTSGPSAGPVHENLTSPRLVQGFGNVTTATYVYHFVATLDGASLSYNVTGTGNVTLQVTDGANATVLNQTLAAPAQGNASLAGAVAGNWTYRLDYASFNGTVTLDLVAPASSDGAPQAPGTTSSSSATTTATAAGNGTADADAEEQAPAPGPVLVAIVVAAVAWAARRRSS